MLNFEINSRKNYVLTLCIFAQNSLPSNNSLIPPKTPSKYAHSTQNSLFVKPSAYSARKLESSSSFRSKVCPLQVMLTPRDRETPRETKRNLETPGETERYRGRNRKKPRETGRDLVRPRETERYDLG